MHSASANVVSNDTISWEDAHRTQPVARSSTSAFGTGACDDPMWDSRSSPASPARDNKPYNQHIVKTELTSSPDFRLSRPSSVLPPHAPNLNLPYVAISTHHHNTSTNIRQDVRHLAVNTSASYHPSTATRSDVYYNIRTSGSSSTPSHHVLTHHSQRPRTSNQVFSTPDLLAHYGLPSILPPAPSTAPRIQSAPQPTHTAIPGFTDFQSLSANYLNMLSQKPDNNMTNDSGNTSDTVSPSDLQGPALAQEEVSQEALASLMEIFATQASPVSPDLNTPELEPPSPEFDFFTSPTFTPNDDFLTTPVMAGFDSFDDNVMTSYGDMGDMLLFPESEEYMVDDMLEKPPVPVAKAKMYTISPSTPSLSSFSHSMPVVNPGSIYPSPRLPSNLSSFSSPAPSASSLSASRRKSSATGTRKGVTPEALVPIDAPTQPRKYVTPSATSRKEVPSVFAKKRARSQAFGDEEDELFEEPLRPGATEKEQIEYKRRQNTVAARRSRKRKLLHQQHLEETIERLTRSVDVWRTRAHMCQEMLAARGVNLPPFDDDEEL